VEKCPEVGGGARQRAATAAAPTARTGNDKSRALVASASTASKQSRKGHGDEREGICGGDVRRAERLGVSGREDWRSGW